MKTSKLILISSLAFAACGGGGGASGVETTIIRPRASYELGCPDARLAVTQVTRSTFSVRGCGARVTYACMGGMGNYACSREGEVEGRSAPPQPPATAEDVTQAGAPVSTEILPRARERLGCEDVRILQIARLTYAAHGCGDSLVYACMGGMGQYQCQLE